MTRLVGSELLKLRTARSFWAQAGITLGLVVLATVLTLAFDHGYFDEHRVRNLLSTGFASGLLMLILGVVFSAGEYRHGTIAWTLLVTPDRWRATGAQTMAAGIAGLAVGLATVGLTAAIGLPWLDAKGAAELPAGDLVKIFLGGALYTGLAAALGAAVGSLVRNQVAGIVGLLVLMLVLDPAASAVKEEYAKFSLQGLAVVITGGNASDVSGGDLLPFGLAVLLWAGYTVSLFVTAAFVTSRRDV
jgi:hypothetical protein